MAEMKLPKSLLVGSREPSMKQRLSGFLQTYNIRVEQAIDASSALYLFEQGVFDCALLELAFGDQSGLTLVQKWRNHERPGKQAIGIILILASGTELAHKQESLIKELGEMESLVSSFKPPQLLVSLQKAYAKRTQTLNYYELQHTLFSKPPSEMSVEEGSSLIKQNLPKLGDKGIELMLNFLERAGRHEEVLNLATVRLKDDPENILYLNAAGRALMNMKRFNEARVYLEKADKLAPMHIARSRQMADMYLELAEPELAVKKMQSLIEMHPESADEKMSNINKLVTHGYADHARNLCKDIAVPPTEVIRFYNNKGVLLVKEGKIDEAIAAYKSALELFPKYKDNHKISFNLALALCRKGRDEDKKMAERLLAAVVVERPDYPKAREILAHIRTPSLGSKVPIPNEDPNLLSENSDKEAVLPPPGKAPAA